jgi:hypothetical protein
MQVAPDADLDVGEVCETKWLENVVVDALLELDD